MPQITQLANPVVRLNNIPIPIIPNSLKVIEGYGDQVVKALSIGNGNVVTIYHENVENKVACIKFQIPAQIDSLEYMAEAKEFKNQNTITLADDNGYERAFNNCVLTSNYEVNIGAEQNTDIEFYGDPARL